jgi:hypothetical protein
MLAEVGYQHRRGSLSHESLRGSTQGSIRYVMGTKPKRHGWVKSLNTVIGSLRDIKVLFFERN